MRRIAGGTPGADADAAWQPSGAVGQQIPLIGAGEPPAFRVLNPQGRARLLVVCDHASRRIPAALDNLGLDELALGRHIASDIGAGDVAELLSARLDAPAVLAGYSRLVVDCNRGLGDPTSILAVSDGEFIPGNQGLSDAQKAERARQFFHPYHDAIARRLESFARRRIVPAFVAVHSFTPIFKNVRRPWQIGILWDKDPRIPVPLIEALRALGIAVGDNEPYSGKAPADHTVDHHAEGGGLPHVSIEIRQDLIDHPEGVARWAGILGDVLDKILADEDLYRKWGGPAMAHREPSFTIGVEEEYLLVDCETRDLVTDMPESMIEDCEHEMEARGQVSPEFLRAQIEVGTKVCESIGEVRQELGRMRECVRSVAERHGCAPIAASTHPFARWLDQRHTDKERYDSLGRELQAAARRLLICGMHVHVGIEDEETRIDLMSQFAYFLPHLLALSCSSPFWEGENTGLKSFRLTVFDALPRTGMPENFSSWAEYSRHVEVMVDAGLIEDGTKIWWDVRPSARYPTLETRVMDVCTRIEDAICLAAINQCLLRMLYRLRRSNQRWRTYARMLLMENRWRAMRYSFDEGLLDLGRGAIVPHEQNLGELLELIREDAEALGCTAEVEHAWTILERGTSAHRQVATYERALAGGASQREALEAVVDMLVEESRVGPA